MQNVPNQRWRDRRPSYRPTGEVIPTRQYEVAVIPDDTTAKWFVTGHHYSASYPVARFRFGLYRGAALEGVAVFSIPVNVKTLTSVFPCPPTDATELGRLVLLDSVPGNGESWFIARCFEVLKRDHGIAGVISMSDPVARTATDGRVVFPGHYGCIYQSHNGRYIGRSTAKYQRLLPDGTEFSSRARQKLRKKEQGWRYAADALIRFGADDPGADPTPVDLKAWASRWVTHLTRSQFHPGNYRYVWGLDRSVRKALPEARPFPKPNLEAA